MPTYIVKAKPDEDFYVFWSTIVEGPTAWGARQQLEHFRPAETDADRFVRANERGTSADWIDWPIDEMPYGWNDPKFHVSENYLPVWMNRPDGWWMLPREDLRAFCDALDHGEHPTELVIWEAGDSNE